MGKVRDIIELMKMRWRRKFYQQKYTDEEYNDLMRLSDDQGKTVLAIFAAMDKWNMADNVRDGRRAKNNGLVEDTILWGINHKDHVAIELKGA